MLLTIFIFGNIKPNKHQTWSEYDKTKIIDVKLLCSVSWIKEAPYLSATKSFPYCRCTGLDGCFLLLHDYVDLLYTGCMKDSIVNCLIFESLSNTASFHATS